MLAVAVWAGRAAAQGPIIIGGAKGAGPACQTPAPVCPLPGAPQTLPPPTSSVPSAPSAPAAPPEAAPPPAETPTGTGAFRGPSSTNLVMSNLALAGSGTSATSAAAATGAGAVNLTSQVAATPSILPGLLTAASVQSARPMDRVFFTYSYLDRFQVLQGGSPSISSTTGTPLTVFSPVTRQPGFNLNMYYAGVEKTFLDGAASAYVVAPFLQATNNTTGQAIDGVGDIFAGLKYVLWSDAQRGSLFTVGMTVATPTGHNSTVTTQQLLTFPAGATSPATVQPFTSTVNPTYLQPWLAALLARDRVFVQEYFGVIIPTDSAVSTFINNDIAVGFQLYRSQCSFLSSITPIIDLQTLLPINHIGSSTTSAAGPTALGMPAGTPPALFATSNTLTFSNQVFLTSGVQFGLGDRAMLTTGVITPLAGPKAFNWGVTVGLNLFY
jgi:hypothetical protein